MPKLILASTSPRRKDLMKELGLEFEVIPAKVEETSSSQFSPRELCQTNAHRKARAVGEQHPDALVVGADTIVCLGHQVYGKPKDLADAIATLKQLQGKPHEVITGLCLYHHQTNRNRLCAVSTRVTFRALGITDIENYLRRIDPYDKAGSYAIQEYGELIVEEIEGSFTNVVGLPTERLEKELKNW